MSASGPLVQLCLDGSFWVEPVLSKVKVSCSRTQHNDAGEAGNLGLESSTLPLCSYLNLNRKKATTSSLPGLT